jgi:fructokinase
MVDVIALGEVLIDFVSTESGVSLIEAPAFHKAPGGAPANVAVGLARLGISSGFIGKVGEDEFGHFLAQVLSDNGVDITGLRFSTEARTMLAFVSIHPDGERDFMFYRHPSADMLLKPEEIDADYIGGARILHHGSISLISEPSRSATLEAIRVAREKGLRISYDPNLRLSLWPSAQAAREGILEGWRLADVAKISRDELIFLSETEDFDAATKALWHEELQLLVITEGAQGCHYVTPESQGHVPGFKVKPVDTTGAGDGFVAGLLAGLVTTLQSWQDPATVETVLYLANAVGALTTKKRGAIPSLPTRAEVEAFAPDAILPG